MSPSGYVSITGPFTLTSVKWNTHINALRMYLIVKLAVILTIITRILGYFNYFLNFKLFFRLFMLLK